MTLILRPLGRGAWHTITVTFNGRRAPRDAILQFKPGDRFPLGGQVYRIVGVFS